MPEQFDQAFWDERYRSHDALWSGEPNPHLVSETDGLTPGAALDVAAVRALTQSGWPNANGGSLRSTCPPTALQRAAAHARRLGGDVAERIDWVHSDLMNWDPGPVRYQLVSAQYLHLQSEPRQALVDHLGVAVAPGGTLLIVGHHPSDLETTMPRPPEPDLFFTGDDIAAELNSEEWVIVTNAAEPRTATDPESRTVTIHDAVLRARRRRWSPPKSASIGAPLRSIR